MDPTDITATFVPSQPLTLNHSFSVNLTTAIRDLVAGNPLPGDASFGFTTRSISPKADRVTFSLLNGTSQMIPPTSQAEVDSLRRAPDPDWSYRVGFRSSCKTQSSNGDSMRAATSKYNTFPVDAERVYYNGTLEAKGNRVSLHEGEHP